MQTIIRTRTPFGWDVRRWLTDAARTLARPAPRRRAAAAAADPGRVVIAGVRDGAFDSAFDRTVDRDADSALAELDVRLLRDIGATPRQLARAEARGEARRLERLALRLGASAGGWRHW